MADDQHPAGHSARMGLQSTATLAAIGLSLSGMYAITGVGVPCPWRYLTHTLCPFCGATTLGAALLRGDLGAAWAANQFVFLILAALVVVSLVWTIELASGRSVPWPGWLRSQRSWYLMLGTVAVLFALLRNLVSLG